LGETVVGVVVLVAGFASGVQMWGRWIAPSMMMMRIDVRSRSVGLMDHSGSVKTVVRPSRREYGR